MNSIDNNILFTYKIKNNRVIPILDALISAPIKASQHLSIAKSSLFPYLHLLVLAIYSVKKLPHFTLLLIAS